MLEFTLLTITSLATTRQKSAYHAKYLRTSWTDLYLLYTFGRHMGEDDDLDIRFAVVQRTLLWQPVKFGRRSPTLSETTFTLCSGVRQLLRCCNVGGLRSHSAHDRIGYQQHFGASSLHPYCLRPNPLRCSLNSKSVADLCFKQNFRRRRLLFVSASEAYGRRLRRRRVAGQYLVLSARRRPLNT